MQGPDTWNYVFLTNACRIQGLGMPKARLVTTSEPLRTELLSTGSYITILATSWVHLNAHRYALKALPVDLPCGLWRAPGKGGAFQWVQDPPGNRSSRKQPEQSWR